MSDQSTICPPPVSGMIEFKVMEEFPGYAVSYDYIRAYVWSCRRTVQQRGVVGSTSGIGDAWRERSPVPNTYGHHMVMLHRDRKQFTFLVHRLILEVFVGPCPQGMEARHGIAGKHCNLPSNLCWGTREENMADKLRDGTHARGERFYAAKITEEQARTMFVLRSAGLTNREIARRYGVGQPHVSRILTGKRWPHLQPNATMATSN